MSLWLYLKEYVGVSRVEEVRQPLLDPFDHLRPHRVHQEIITWHCVSFVTEGRGGSSKLKIYYIIYIVTASAIHLFFFFSTN